MRKHAVDARACSQPRDGAGLAEADAVTVSLAGKDEAVVRLPDGEQRAANRLDAKGARHDVAEDFAAHDEGARAAEGDQLGAPGGVAAGDVDPLESRADRGARVGVQRGAERRGRRLERPVGVRRFRRAAVAGAGQIGRRGAAPDRGRVARVAATVRVKEGVRQGAVEPEQFAGRARNRVASDCRPPRRVEARRLIELAVGRGAEIEALAGMAAAVRERVACAPAPLAPRTSARQSSRRRRRGGLLTARLR